MAETAKKAAPKGMEGVEAIMMGEGAMDVARGAVKQISPDAPYALEGSESMMMQEDPLPRREKVDGNDGMIPEQDAKGEKKQEKKEPAFSDEDIKEHLEKDKSIKSFLAQNLKSAQFAVKSFNSRGKGKSSRKDSSSREDDPNYA